MAKKTSKKPYKFRQARKDAKAGAKDVFTGKRKAAVKDITTKQTLEEREALKELSDARKRQKAGKADFIIDDRGNRVEVKPTETAQERFARDRAEARRIAYEMYPEDETELDKQKARKARMEAKNKAAIAKQKADKAANRGRNAPTLQQTPANEKPLSRPVKKSATKPAKGVGGTAGTVAKPKPGLAAQIKKDVAKVKANKAAASKPAVKKPAATKTMSRAEKSAANKAAWKNMTPAQRKNWSANKPNLVEGGLTPRQESALQRRVAKTDKKLLQIKARDPKKFAAREKIAADPKLTAQQKAEALQKIGKSEKLKPAAPAKPGKYLEMQTQKRAAQPKVNPKYAVAVRPKAGELATKAVVKQGAKKAGVGAALKGAGRLAGKLVTGRVGAALAIGSVIGEPVLRALVKEPAGAKKAKDYSVKKEAMAKVKPDYSVKRQAVRPVVGGGGSTYTVKKGDTLSSIAKANNTTLSAIREANPEIMKKKKYKQGAMIWSGTQVKIPKK